MSDLELSGALQEWVAFCRGRGVECRGYSEEAIAAREAAMGKRLPEEVRALYLVCDAASWWRATGTGKVREPGIGELKDVVWTEGLIYPEEEGGEILEEAKGCRSWLGFGGFGFGDPLVWAEHWPVGGPPAILFVYHEGGNPKVLGRSMAQWLRRMVNGGGREYADVIGWLFDVEGPKFDDLTREEIIGELVELNPELAEEVERERRRARGA